MWLGMDSRTRRNMWVGFVVGSLLCSERFFSGYSGFALSSKTNISKILFDPDFSGRIATLWRCHSNCHYTLLVSILSLFPQSLILHFHDLNDSLSLSYHSTMSFIKLKISITSHESKNFNGNQVVKNRKHFCHRKTRD